MERDRRDDPEDEELAVGLMTSLPTSRDERVGDAARPARLMPQPDKAPAFGQALDEVMTDHRAVLAALAK